MMRTQANSPETFPIAPAAILIVEVAGLNASWTAIGAVAWLATRRSTRSAFPGLRSLLFATSIVGTLARPALA